MFRRLFWLFLGVGVGMGSSLWVMRRVKQTAARYTPERVSDRPGRAPSAASGATCASSVQEGREAMLQARGRAPRRPAARRRLTARRNRHPSARTATRR